MILSRMKSASVWIRNGNAFGDCLRSSDDDEVVRAAATGRRERLRQNVSAPAAVQTMTHSVPCPDPKRSIRRDLLVTA